MITVPANDHGAIYVIELNRPTPEGLEDKTDAALMAVFGQLLLNTDYVDVITPGRLGDMRLVDLIRGGYDMPVTAADEAALEGLMGTVVLVMSAAFGGTAHTIDLPADVRLVTVLRETPQMTVTAPIATDSTDGLLTPKTKPAKSDARIGGMVALAVLILLFALVALMIWVGG